jgi:hypothetical protein
VYGDENYTTGITGQAILLDGNDFVEFGNVANPVDDSYSVSIWFNSSITGKNNRILFNKESLFEGAAGNVATYAFQPNWAWYGNTPVTLNNWHHMVVTYDGSYQRMYIDGTETFSRAHTGNMGSNTNPLKVGARGAASGSGYSFFTGAIDEFAIYDGTLTPTEVSNLFNSNLSRLSYSSDTLVVSKLTHNFVTTTTAGEVHNLTIFRPYFDYNETLTFSTTDTTLAIANQTLNIDSIILPIRFKRAGDQTIIYTDGTISDTVSVTVSATDQEGISVELETAQTGFYGENVGYNLTVTAVDTFNNPVPSYTGTVTFALVGSSPASGKVPGPYTFTAPDMGQVVFLDSVVFSSGGGFDGTIISITDGSYTDSTTAFSVLLGTQPDHYQFDSYTNPFLAGKTDSITVRSVDINGDPEAEELEFKVTSPTKFVVVLPSESFKVNVTDELAPD